MKPLRINIVFICSIMLSSLAFGQSESNKSTLDFSDSKEQVRDILEVGDGYIVLTYALGSKEIKIHYFDEYGSASWAHKPYLFVYDSKDGSTIAQQKRTIIDQFNEVTITIFSVEPENWVQARSTGYKGISKYNDDDPHWVRSMSKLLKGKPVAVLAKIKFYAVFSKSGHTVIFEYDKKDKKTKSLTVYRYD